MQVNSVMINKFSSNTGMLDDTEIATLISYYSRIEEALSPCPPEYKLTVRDVRAKLDRLNDIKQARQKGKDWCTRHRERNIGQNIAVRA